jgi:hypothetical protein
MKILILLALLLASFALTATAADAPATGKSRKGKLRHVVSFKWKETSSKDDIQKVVEAFKQLPKKITDIKDFEYGTNNSPENLNKGFTHAWILTFETEEARNGYLKHAAHDEFVKIAGPHIGDVYVIDFWSEK